MHLHEDYSGAQRAPLLDTSAPSLTQRRLQRGACLYDQGNRAAHAWQVEQGSFRLDLLTADGAILTAGLGLRDDILGVEGLLEGVYAFRATALSDCLVTAWYGPQPGHPRATLDLLARNARRSAELMSLRNGLAVTRIRRLIDLIRSNDDSAGLLELPDQKAMAEITGLTHETVCRVMAQLRAEGEVERAGKWRFLVTARAPIAA